MNKKIALINVYDKTNIIELAYNLEKLNYEIYALKGVAKELKKTEIDFIELDDKNFFYIIQAIEKGKYVDGNFILKKPTELYKNN